MAGAGRLFSEAPPRVFTIPAPTSFLDVLADAVVEALSCEAAPFALSDALILLPTRRAARGLMDAFAARLGGAALLPAMRPLADLEDDPDVWGPEPIDFALPPAIAPLQRRMELAWLIRAKDAAAGGVDDPVRALAFADELCALLDGAAAAGEVDWSRLPNLVEDERLAAHWRQSAEFLSIISAYWPERLAADGLSDPGARRTRLLLTLAARWRAKPPQTPVIIAGSTGSLPATRALMAAAAGLPLGAVVLPGLDAGLDDPAWESLGPQHPQATLKETLTALQMDRGGVPALGPALAPRQAARAVLLREALAPADATADWLSRIAASGGAQTLQDGAAGLTLIETDTEMEEAAVIALALRSAVEEDGADAALVTPSAALARRVAAKLERLQTPVAVSLGRPLTDSPVGELLLTLLALAEDDADPTALATAFKHPLRGAQDEKAIAAFEHAKLRGPRRARRLHDLLTSSEDATEGVLAPLAEALALMGAPSPEEKLLASVLAEGLCAAGEALCGEALWEGPAGEAAARVMRETIAAGEALGAMSRSQAVRTLRLLLQRTEVPPAPAGDARIAIFGPLEARLQRRTLIVLGGLNEGVWPEAPPEGAFLSRRMRADLGFAPTDQRIGLAAHDFAQLASAPRVLLTRARRENGAPSVASRWIWRLSTLLKGAKAEELVAPGPGQPFAAWARAIDKPEAVRPTPPPAPRLAAPHFLRRLSVTEVDTLIRDPYAVYARRILGLKALRGVGVEAGPAERGSAVHKALERFERAEPGLRDKALLLSLLTEELRGIGFRPGQLASDQARLEEAAAAYAAWSQEQGRPGARVLLEKRGVLKLLDGAFSLSAQADRIDLYADGTAQIVDVKTGQPPTVDQMHKHFSPQLLLEAAMLAEGGFEDAPPAITEALIFWRFAGSKAEPCAPVLKDRSVMDAAQDAKANLEGLLNAYRGGLEPFRSKPRAFFARPYADYDLLARRQEWAAEGEE